MMLAKCSLTGYNPFLQLLGLLFMAFILVIVVIYYLQVYHTSILEKYENAASAAVNPATLKFNTFSDAADASAATTLDIYPGAKLDLVGLGTKAIAAAITADSGDTFTLRDCKVYFTDDIDGCDKQQDTTTKTCSYKLDGWQEFNTYTDNNGGTITYEKKKYKTDATGELINAHLTSKCFKEFDSEGNGNARGFEYKQNALITYDAKGTTNNGVLDANTFGGKKYTSIKFMNSPNAGDNLEKVIDSICSVKYDTIAALNGKVFYKFILNANNNIEAISKLSLNTDQTGFSTFTVNGNAAVAVNDFATLGSHGLRFDNNNNLQAFINKAVVSKQMNIYKFTYLSNICTTSQIKSYAKYSQNIKVTDFLTLGNPVKKNDGTEPITELVIPNINNLSLVRNRDNYRGTDANGNYLDYKKEIMEGLATDRKKVIDDLDKNSASRLKNNTSSLADIDRRIRDSGTTRANFVGSNPTFLNIIALQNNNTRIFNYASGYVNTRLDSASVPTTAFNPQFTSGSPSTHAAVPNTTDKIMIFTATNTNHTFTVPTGGMNCDILMIGGGGGARGYRGGSGSGACIVAISHTIPAGNCIVRVGNGGSGSSWENGQDSSITVNGNPRYLAKGGATNSSSGGCGAGAEAAAYGHRSIQYGTAAVNTNIITLREGQTTTVGPTVSDYNNIAVFANKGGNQLHTYSNSYGNAIWGTAGGGGIGEAGSDHLANQLSGARGGNGLYEATINGRRYNFRDYFANGGNNFGVLDGSSGNYYIGGGGGGYAWRNPGGAGGLGGGGKIEGNGGPGAPNTGSGATPVGVADSSSSANGGSGIIIIRYRATSSTTSAGTQITAPNITDTTDAYYNNAPSAAIVMPASKIQVGVITSFAYLQRGFYRFRADIGNQGDRNPNIMYAELVIYDESNRGSNNYNCKKVFKYTMNNGKYEPAFLKQYIQIPTSKFYKLAYTYYYDNKTQSDITDYLNTYYTYLSTAPERLENDVPSNLIAFYQFNNSLNDNNPDTSVSKYNLVDTYGRSPNFQTDPSNGRKYINTTNSSVKTVSAVNLSRRSFSISLWYRAKTSNYTYFVGHGQINASSYKHLYIYSGHGNYGLDFWGNHYSKSGYSADVGNWVHLAFVIDVPMYSSSCTRKMYRNGVEIHSDTAGQLYEGNGTLYIGDLACYGEGWNNKYFLSNADISDFMLYSKALSADEVKGLYNNTPTTAGTSSGAYTPPTVLLSDATNDDNLFIRSSLTSINTSLTNYLFSGPAIYSDYRNTNLISIFSTIGYTGNNSGNYNNLINYLATDSVDFFNMRSLSIQRQQFQAAIDGEQALLASEKTGSQAIQQLDGLTTRLNEIVNSFTNLLPIGPPVLKTDATFTTIFGNNKEATYITEDKIADINNFANVELKKAIYIEAII